MRSKELYRHVFELIWLLRNSLSISELFLVDFVHGSPRVTGPSSTPQ